MNKSKLENGEVIEEFRKIFPKQKYEDRSGGYYIKADYFTIEAFISNALNQQREQIVGEIEEIIGKDEWTMKDRGAMEPLYSNKNLLRNKLRKQQRVRLVEFLTKLERKDGK